MRGVWTTSTVLLTLLSLVYLMITRYHSGLVSHPSFYTGVTRTNNRGEGVRECGRRVADTVGQELGSDPMESEVDQDDNAPNVDGPSN